MRLIAICAVLALSGCAQVLTLYPRGGGEQATGTLNDGSREMMVQLKNEIYTGRFVPGQTFGFAMGQSFGAMSSFGTGMMVGSTNQSTALLTSGKNVLRCELKIAAAVGGSGVCVDKDNVTYDLLIKPTR
jgi:hypothetical protein